MGYLIWIKSSAEKRTLNIILCPLIIERKPYERTSRIPSASIVIRRSRYSAPTAFLKTFLLIPKTCLIDSGEDLSLNVWASGGGGPQGHVRVSFNFRNLEHYGNFRQIMGRVSDTYDEIYGNNAWDTDIQLLRESLEMWGAQTELVRFLPELSSPPIALQE